MQDNLGFEFHLIQGEITIYHRGKKATILRGQKAKEISAELNESSFEEQQQLMARLTGNYKRGNERLAKNHPRNKRR